MPMLAPPTMAILSFRPRSMSARLHADLAEEPFGILVEYFVQDLLRVAFGPPFPDEALVGEQRIVASEHDAVLEAARNLVLEVRRVVFGRPAVQLVPDVSLVHQH